MAVDQSSVPVEPAGAAADPAAAMGAAVGDGGAGAAVAATGGPGLLQVLTLVLWLVCLAVGLLGLWLQNPKPRPPAEKAPPPPLQAELLDVQLDAQPMAAELTAPAPDPASTPEPPPPEDLPPAPIVVAPTPAIAFAVPVEGPVQIVPLKQANIARVPEAPAPAQPQPPRRAVVKQLTYGLGEGRQPAPDYPPQAVIERQEGAVGVQFVVGDNGRVISAQVIVPSRWPLLNQSAVRAIRDRWQLRPGTYAVTIRFHLNEL